MIKLLPPKTSALVIACFLVSHAARADQAAVNLNTANNYVILSKSGISTVPTSAVTGNLGVSPIDSTAITGFTLTLDSFGRFSTSAQVTGHVYAADYATPTPTRLTAAVGDMETAYTDAAGRTLPDYTELESGSIGGLTLYPGLYKWSGNVTAGSDVTLSGGATNVWIFQIAGDLTINSSAQVLLSGGAQAANVFWQVAGGVGADLGSYSHFEGIILAAAGITLETGASVNGKLLAQTDVTLEANTIANPVTPLPSPTFGPTSIAPNGAVSLVITNTPGVPFTVQSSPDLINWTSLATPTAAASPYPYTDNTAPGNATRFYRIVYP